MMNRPATTCPTTVPTSVTRVTAPPLPVESVMARCADSIQPLSWLSLRLSGPDSSQLRTWSSPSTTEAARSWAPLATCWPT